MRKPSHCSQRPPAGIGSCSKLQSPSNGRRLRAQLWALGSMIRTSSCSRDFVAMPRLSRLAAGGLRAAAHERQSRSSRYRPIIVSRAAPGSLRIVDQRISNHFDRSASCCDNPAHNRAIKDIHYLNGLYNIRDRSTRSLLERSCAALIPKLQFIVPAPAQVRTPQLKLQSALGARNNRHKVRRNSFWFTHRPQECAATSLVRIRHPSLRSAIS